MAYREMISSFMRSPSHISAFFSNLLANFNRIVDNI